EPQYEVVEARDGLDALEMLERAEPDFVVLDVMMPLMDGIQTCQAIRANHRYSDMSVLFLTALSSKEDIRRGYDVGTNLYLTKHFVPTRLCRNVDMFFVRKEGVEPPHRRFPLREIRNLKSEGPAALAQVARTAESAPEPKMPDFHC